MPLNSDSEFPGIPTKMEREAKMLTASKNRFDSTARPRFASHIFACNLNHTKNAKARINKPAPGSGLDVGLSLSGVEVGFKALPLSDNPIAPGTSPGSQMQPGDPHSHHMPLVV